MWYAYTRNYRARVPTVTYILGDSPIPIAGWSYGSFDSILKTPFLNPNPGRDKR